MTEWTFVVIGMLMGILIGAGVVDLTEEDSDPSGQPRQSFS